MNPVLIIVGNKFEHFADQHPSVLTVDHFLKMVISKDERLQSQSHTVIFGQGISFDQQMKLRHQIKTQYSFNKIYIYPAKIERKAKDCYTHKNFSKNTLISEPKRLSISSFECFLWIDDECAELSDHVTGQHIQGMVLIEAARQMTLAVTEKFYIPDNNRKKVSFLTHELISTFYDYIFPTPVQLQYEILKHRKMHGSNQTFLVKMKCLQLDKVKTSIQFRFSVLSKKILAEKEQLMAVRTISNTARLLEKNNV